MNVNRLYGRIAKKYAKEYWGKSSIYDKYIDKFLSFLNKGSRILDAGCGAGDSVAYFLKKGFHAEGIDISPEFISIAKKKVPKGRFRLMDVRRLKYKSGVFDAIYAFALLEHIPKSQIIKVLKDFARILKNKGFLFITTPRGRGEHFVYYPLAKEKFKASFYIIKEIKSLLKETNFKLIDYSFMPRIYKSQARYNRIFVIAKKK